MKSVRLGIVGLGNIGAMHAGNVLGGRAGRLTLAAVCDPDPAVLARFPDARGFTAAEEMFASGAIDAALVATPHWSHPDLGAAALRRGLHVLVEKPVAVHKTDAQKLIAAWRRRPAGNRPVFAAMFNQRTDPAFIALRRLVQGGELGEIRRVSWTITDWFRTALYYASSPWRATWPGEGGGVLLNQCPHNLDLLQWIFGQPRRVTAFCRFGRYHDIEVEDDVTAYLEFPGGATGTFVTTTGEAPGTNRLEVAGERGRVVLEGGRLSFLRNEVPMTEFSLSAKEAFAKPACAPVEIPLGPAPASQHCAVLANFADAVIDGGELIAPAADGVHSVELANAMLLSTWLEKPVELPFDAEEYEMLLKRRIAKSRPKKSVQKQDDSAGMAAALKR